MCDYTLTKQAMCKAKWFPPNGIGQYLTFRDWHDINVILSFLSERFFIILQRGTKD